MAGYARRRDTSSDKASRIPHPNLLPKGEGTRSLLTVFIRIDSTKKTLDGFYAFDDGYRDIDVGQYL
jgi:hypothetical protein